MSPKIAALLCFLCIAYLFWADRKNAEGISIAIWIPILWMLFAGSRFPSQWLNLGPPANLSVQDYLDGSPLDRNVFLALLGAGIVVLVRRRVNWPATLRTNIWIALFFLFAAASALWSDDPVVCFKRWVKGVGNVVMALIVLTEERPSQAVGFVLKRLAYVLVPLSVLFIRYFPDLGRAYHMGVATVTGVAFQKNSLAQLCLLLAIYFVWDFLFGSMRRREPQGPIMASTGFIILPMLVWLIYMSQSATAFGVVVTAMAVLFGSRLPIFLHRPQRLIGFAVVVAVLAVVLEYSVGITAWAIHALGRNPDLTERKPVWDILLSMAANRWVGAGYEMFLSGDRLIEIFARMNRAGGTGQAHNGYIDLYLNLGFIGVGLLVVAIVAGLVDAVRQLGRDYPYSVLRITLIVATVMYNYTEAAWKPLNNVFVLLLISILHLYMLRAKRVHREGLDRSANDRLGSAPVSRGLAASHRSAIPHR
jgi:exopolysaccharide production protein ExoQ